MGKEREGGLEKERETGDREKEIEKERQIVRERGIFQKLRRGTFVRSNVRVVWIYFSDE